MFISLILGCGIVVVSMVIQVFVVVKMIRYLNPKMKSPERRATGTKFEISVISMVLIMLFMGHMLQIAIWAMVFVVLGEFSDFLTAFYHSAVNFASLGYGDIVMGERWRLLGALEASNGVLMFGLSAGTMLAVMTRLFAPRATDNSALRD